MCQVLFEVHTPDPNYSCFTLREPIFGINKSMDFSKVVSTHRTGTHPEQPLPTGYNGIPVIVGERGIAWGVL